MSNKIKTAVAQFYKGTTRTKNINYKILRLNNYSIIYLRAECIGDYFFSKTQTIKTTIYMVSSLQHLLTSL